MSESVRASTVSAEAPEPSVTRRCRRPPVERGKRTEKRFSPVALTDVVEAVGAGGFAAIGVSAVAMGLPYLKNYLPLGTVPGAVSSSGTIALISFFVGLEVAAAFILIIGELLDQTLLIRRGSR